MKKLAWLIFIVGKIKLLKGSEDLTEFVFILFAVIYQVVMLSPSDVKCALIESKYSHLLNIQDFKKTVPQEKHSKMRGLLDTYVRDYLKQTLKTNGAQSDAEIALSVKSIQDLLTKVGKFAHCVVNQPSAPSLILSIDEGKRKTIRFQQLHQRTLNLIEKQLGR
jgi:hypothetical protein